MSAGEDLRRCELFSHLVFAKDVAPILQVSEQRVYEMVRLGIIPAGVAVRMGRQVRFNLDRLHEWIEQGGSRAE